MENCGFRNADNKLQTEHTTARVQADAVAYKCLLDWPKVHCSF